MWKRDFRCRGQVVKQLQEVLVVWLLLMMGGCAPESESLKMQPTVSAAHISDVSLAIDGKDALASKLTMSAGETYPINGRFRMTGGTLARLKARLLAEKSGQTIIMNEAFVEFKDTNGLVTFETPFRMTPKPGEFELRLEGELDGKASEMKKNVITSTIVRVVEAD